MTNYKTEQEEFWKGEFGSEYIDRMNKKEKRINSNVMLFSKIISTTKNISSIIEFGCNVGLNLKALKRINPDYDICGVEINHRAVEELKKWGKCEAIEDSLLNFKSDRAWDFSFAKGVLIHINPNNLPIAYKTLYESSKKYIMIMDYYNPVPVSVEYRGYKDKLFKRDFAGEMLEIYPDLELVDYVFIYHKDFNLKEDDTTWFLMQKK